MTNHVGIFLWISLAALLTAGTLHAAPFVVSDPIDQRATHCGWQMDGGQRTDALVAASGADKICKLDLASLAGGSHTVNAPAVAVDAIWGRLESPPSANRAHHLG